MLSDICSSDKSSFWAHCYVAEKIWIEDERDGCVCVFLSLKYSAKYYQLLDSFAELWSHKMKADRICTWISLPYQKIQRFHVEKFSKGLSNVNTKCHCNREWSLNSLLTGSCLQELRLLWKYCVLILLPSIMVMLVDFLLPEKSEVILPNICCCGGCQLHIYCWNITVLIWFSGAQDVAEKFSTISDLVLNSWAHCQDSVLQLPACLLGDPTILCQQADHWIAMWLWPMKWESCGRK